MAERAELFMSAWIISLRLNFPHTFFQNCIMLGKIASDLVLFLSNSCYFFVLGYSCHMFISTGLVSSFYKILQERVSLQKYVSPVVHFNKSCSAHFIKHSRQVVPYFKLLHISVKEFACGQNILFYFFYFFFLQSTAGILDA